MFYQSGIISYTSTSVDILYYLVTFCPSQRLTGMVNYDWLMLYVDKIEKYDVASLREIRLGGFGILDISIFGKFVLVFELNIQEFLYVHYLSSL